ncbi:hypothetical protein WS89_04425 [Burkholderia sp. MSMB1072]|nr:MULTISPECIES: hypothetical protein [Burkholderia]KVH64534.1 hypothetical protein WS89_04425 [Burkholderia sp. MSMB1072]
MNAQENVFTLENVMIAINRANDRWSKKEGRAGECEDLKTARKYWDDKLCVFAAGMLKRAKISDIEFLSTIADNMGVKAVKRVSEFLACLHAKDYTMLDGVTALSLLSAIHAGAVSRSALVYATTGKGDDSTSDVVRDVSLVNKLRRVIGGVGITTEGTQNSRSFGSNGFCKYLGMGKMVRVKGKEATLEVNEKSPFIAAIAKMVETASDDTLSLVKGAKKDK